MGEEGFEGALDLFPSNFSLKQLQPELSGTFKSLEYNKLGYQSFLIRCAPSFLALLFVESTF